MHLYELAAAFQVIDSAVMLADGEMSPALVECLDKFSGNLSHKIGNIVRMYRNWEVNADALTDESQRLAKLAISRKNAAKGIKAYTVRHLQAMGIDTVMTDLGKVRVQKNSRPSVTFEGDPEKLPLVFKITKVTADTEAAYEAWKIGAELPPGFTVREGHHLRIY